MITFFAQDPHNAAVYNEHGTGSARGHPAIEGCAFQRDAKTGSLAYGILFGVHGAHAMPGDPAILVKYLFHQVPHIIAMRQAPRGADITGNQYLLVTGDNASTPPAVAGCPLGDSMGDLHKIFIPTWTNKSVRIFSAHISDFLEYIAGSRIFLRFVS